jgi:hypothetical protein
MNRGPHRAHDYRHLVARWRTVAREGGLTMRAFAEESGYPVFSLRSKTLGKTGGIYISAGIHGDEPAATEGLVTWAEQNIKRLANLPLILFPCLNPWGLVNNSRVDATGRDLNRVFHHDEACAVGALKRLIQPYHFDLALMLHEDYDGQGVYIYELEKTRPFWGEALLKKVHPVLPVDSRARIDGRKAVSGLVRRKINPKRFQKLGFPEAIYLHLHHAARTFTIETPSEFALDRRVRAQVTILRECLKRAVT